MSKEPIKILLIDDEVQFVDTLKDRLFLRGLFLFLLCHNYYT